MKDQEQISYAVPDPDKFVPKPWKAHRHIRTRIVRPNEFLGVQTVTFATASQRDDFLRAQSAARNEPVKNRHRNAQYGAHQRDRHLVNAHRSTR